MLKLQRVIADEEDGDKGLKAPTLRVRGFDLSGLNLKVGRSYGDEIITSPVFP
jgi:hypothetical protein